MLAFQVRGGVEGMAAFTDHLALCDVGVSLGDIFTLVYPQPKRGGLIRVSVGCEDVDDLVEDFSAGCRSSPDADDRAGIQAAADLPERGRGGERGADRQVDAAVDLVLRRPEERLVAGAPRSASAGSRMHVGDGEDAAGADRPALRALAHREQEQRRGLHLGREVAAPAPARRAAGLGSP